MRSLVDGEGYAFPVLLDDSGIGSLFKVRYVPTLFLIDAQGKIRERIVGAVDYARLVSLVHGLAR